MKQETLKGLPHSGPTIARVLMVTDTVSSSLARRMLLCDLRQCSGSPGIAFFVLLNGADGR